MVINRDLTFRESDHINPPLTKGTVVEVVVSMIDEVPSNIIPVYIAGIMGYVELPKDCVSEE
jgi:hypothetical protein